MLVFVTLLLLLLPVMFGPRKCIMYDLLGYRNALTSGKQDDSRLVCYDVMRRLGNPRYGFSLLKHVHAANIQRMIFLFSFTIGPYYHFIPWYLYNLYFSGHISRGKVWKSHSNGNRVYL